MKIKLTNPEKPQQLGTIGRTLGGSLLNLLETAQGLGSLLPQPSRVTQGLDIPRIQQPLPPSQILLGELGREREEFKPQNMLETGVQSFLPKAAQLALLKGLNPATLGLSAAGSAVEGITGSPTLGALSELGLGLKGPQRIRNLLTPQAAQKQAQIKLENLTPQAAKKSPEIVKAVFDIESKLAKETTSDVKTKIKSALETLSSHLGAEKITPKDALDLRKNLYHTAQSLDPSKAAEYIQPLTKAINRHLATYTATHPDFYKALSTRDRLTEMRNMQGLLADFADITGISKIPYVKPIFDKVIGGTIDQSTKVLKNIYSNPEARKYYFNLVRGASKNNPNYFTNNLVKLGKLIQPKNEIKDKSFKIRLT